MVKSTSQVETLRTIPTFHSYRGDVLGVGLDELRENGSEFRIFFEEYERQENIEPGLFGNWVRVRRARARRMNHERRTTQQAI